MLDSRGDNSSQGGYIGGPEDNNYSSDPNATSSSLGNENSSPSATQDFDDEIPFKNWVSIQLQINKLKFFNPLCSTACFVGCPAGNQFVCNKKSQLKRL